MGVAVFLPCSLAWGQTLAEIKAISIKRTYAWSVVFSAPDCTVVTEYYSVLFTAPPINRKLDWRFTEHGPTHQNKTQFPPQSVSPIRKLPWISYPSPSEDRQNENHNHRKLTNLIMWTTALSNSMKQWAMPCRATQDGQVMVESSDKTWSTGEGNGKPLQYSCLEKPML